MNKLMIILALAFLTSYTFAGDSEVEPECTATVDTEAGKTSPETGEKPKAPVKPTQTEG